MAQLITCATHAEAHRLKRILNSEDIILGDHLEIPSFGSQVLRLPLPDSDTYAHEMLKLCLDNQISRLFPLDVKEITELSRSALLFGEYGIEMIIPSQKDIETNLNETIIGSSKLLVMYQGTLLAGELPEKDLPQGSGSGIFEWNDGEGHLRCRIFIVNHAGI